MRALGGTAHAALAATETRRTNELGLERLELGAHALGAGGIVPRLGLLECLAKLEHALAIRRARVLIDHLARVAGVDAVV